MLIVRVLLCLGTLANFITFSIGQEISDSDEEVFFDIDISLDENAFFDIDSGANVDNFFTGDQELEEESSANSPYAITGSFRQNFTYGIAIPNEFFSRQKKGMEKINSELFLQVQGRPSNNTKIKINGLVDYDWGSWANDAYSLGGSEVNFELKDFFIDVTSDSGLWIRLGNQIVARGEIESVKISDIVNPIDISSPGQVEFKDIRIRVPALFVSTPIGNATTEIIVTNDAGSDKLGTTQSGSAFDYSILTDQIGIILPEGVSILSEDKEPSKSWETVARVNYKLNGGDISFIGGEINWNQNSLHAVKESIPLIFEYQFDRVKVAGISGNLVRGDYLLKYEAALNDGRKFQSTDPLTPWIDGREVVTGAGLEYNGLGDIVLSVEVNNSNILDYSNQISRDENATGFILQARWSGFNDLLSLYGSFNELSGDQSTISTVFVEYDLTDDLKFDGRLILYDASSQSDLFYTFKDQDVLKASIKYSF